MPNRARHFQTGHIAENKKKSWPFCNLHNVRFVRRAVDTDPDPAFQVNPDPNPIRIQGFDEKIKKKNTAENFSKYYFDQKLQFTYVQATGELEKPSALKKEHPALQI
jgi:hypothetical protein